MPNKKHKESAAGLAAERHGPATSHDLAAGELPRISDAQPEIVKTVVKLDSRSMVWSHDQIASDVESLGPFIAIVGAFLIAFMLPLVSYGMTQQSSAGLKWVCWLVGVPLLVLVLVGMGYFLKVSLFSRYADLHFNRFTRKIYTFEDGRAWLLDWDRVRPFASYNPGPLTMGAPPFWGLDLVEFDRADSKVWTQRLRVQGVLPDRAACQSVWETIRRYMDEKPDCMPALEVAAGGHGWQAALLEFGPMKEVGPFDDLSLSVTQRLQKYRWWPIISPVRLLYWIGFWPGPLSTILYERFRPRARLPTTWTADELPPVEESNPYKASVMTDATRAGRRKAAWVVGVVCGICISLGIAWTTAFLKWEVIPTLTYFWKDVFGHSAKGGQSVERDANLELSLARTR